MRKLKILKSIIETMLFFFSGFLVKISFSGKLNFISNILIFISSLVIITYIFINDVMKKM